MTGWKTAGRRRFFVSILHPRRDKAEENTHMGTAVQNRPLSGINFRLIGFMAVVAAGVSACRLAVGAAAKVAVARTSAETNLILPIMW